MDITEQIRSRLSIVDLVRQYIPNLKKVGRQWKACCPFHQEKTPSFLVSEDKGLAYCFGCHKGGDIFAFYQEIEGLDFPQAVKELAERTGVQYSVKEAKESKKQKDKKQVLYDLMNDVMSFYEDLLQDKKGKLALDYLKDKRGFKDEIIKKFRLGYCPDSFDETSKYLVKKGYSKEEILDCGIAGASDTTASNTYDRFRHRIMIPIRDPQGRVVGFTSRILDTKRKEGKYVNSPETQIYDKGGVFYGMYESKNTIREKRSIIIVEGNLDVISCHQAGIENVIATSGSALTETQAELLRRKGLPLLFALDHDTAGLHALYLALERTVSLGINTRIIDYEDGKDPDESLQKDVEKFKTKLENSLDFVSGYYIQALNTKDKTESGIIKDTLKLLAFIPSLVDRDDLLGTLQSVSKKSSVTLEKELEIILSQHKFQRPAKEIIEKSSMHPIENELLELALYDPKAIDEDTKFKIIDLSINKSMWEGILNTQKSLNDQQLAFVQKHTILGEQHFGDWGEGKRKAYFVSCVNKWARNEKISSLKNKLELAEDTKSKESLMTEISEILKTPV